MLKADLIIENANILTLDDNNTRAGSISVTDGRISGIWPERKVPRNTIKSSVNMKIIDLQGATLIPGFIDTHNHILSYAVMSYKVNCSTPLNESISDILTQLQKKVKEKSIGEWIEGYGYDDTLLLDKRHPTKTDLDRVSPDNPVLIKHISGHIAAANSKALEIAGLSDKVQNPSGGQIGRDSAGKLDGILYEPAAYNLVMEHIPKPSEEELVSLLGEAANDYLAQGITTNTDAGVGLMDGIRDLNVHLKAAEHGVNPMHTRVMVMHNLLKSDETFGGYTSMQLDHELKQRSEGRVRLDSAKMFQDGSIQGLTGALREPYYNEPNVRGELVHDQESFENEVSELHCRGFRIATHGNGDLAIESILDAYESALKKDPLQNQIHRIEHAQTATSKDLKRMKHLGVAGSFFINHIYYWGDRHEQLFLGPSRAKRLNPLNEAMGQNVLFTLHSDCPVTPISPMFSIWAAVNRLTRSGKVLGSEQRCDVITALKAMTIYGAKLNSDEQNSGSIEVGKRADFAVLEDDPTRVSPKEIKDISIKSTFIDGIPVYEKEGLKTK